MKKNLIPTIKTFYIAGLFVFLLQSYSLYGQQQVIANKDNTRPETTARTSQPAFITSLQAIKHNGYNEIQWSLSLLGDTKQFIVEYSRDGINYQAAGTIIAGKTTYTLKHVIPDDRSFLYRIRSEQLTGKFFYSAPVLLAGETYPPVKIYPTTVTTHSVNIVADWPVERIIVTSTNGEQVFAKEINGQKNYFSVVLPSLSRGMYFMSFYGQGWKTTGKFIIA